MNGITNMIGVLKQGIKSLSYVKHLINNRHATGAIESIMSVIHTTKKREEAWDTCYMIG